MPNVGKSTLFNALTRKSAPAENYPFCTIDPSVGMVEVPDNRLATLARISQSERVIPAIVEFVDIAGLVKGASVGEGLGNKFLANIRETDMVAEVVRIFEDEDVHHVSGVVDPMSDIETINLELIMADAESVSKRMQSIVRDVRSGDKKSVELKSILERLLPHLEGGQLANTLDMTNNEKELAKELRLLTLKPFLYVCNKKQGAFNLDDNNDDRWQELLSFFEETNSVYVIVDAGVEHELKDLQEDEKNDFRREYGTQSNGIDTLIKASYRLLGLISYFTTGEKETRAWTIEEGDTAPEAGAAIHTDFQDKFIRAQVVGFDDLVSAGSKSAAKESGKIRTEGKEYMVKDGDVMEFLHS